MKRLLLLILLSALALSACAPSAAWQREWPTPLGTFTPTPIPLATLPPTATRLFECISWHQAKKYVGQQMCVEGGVTHVHKSEEAFFIYFSKEPDSFCGLSFELDLSDLLDKCVRLVGAIETYEGRPAIIIRSRDQILPCLGK